MDNFNLAIMILTDHLMMTLPNNTDYNLVRETLRKEICAAIQKTRNDMENNNAI